jgi:hypothetical protein
VILDTPVGLTEQTAAALDVSELALLVTTSEVPSLGRTQACLRLLQQLDFPVQKVQIVLNRVKSRTRVSEAEVAQALGHPIAWRVANDDAAMTSAKLGSRWCSLNPRRNSRGTSAMWRASWPVSHPRSVASVGFPGESRTRMTNPTRSKVLPVARHCHDDQLSRAHTRRPSRLLRWYQIRTTAPLLLGRFRPA